MHIPQKITSVFVSVAMVASLTPSAAFADKLESDQGAASGAVAVASNSTASATAASDTQASSSAAASQASGAQTSPQSASQQTADAGSENAWAASSIEYVYIGSSELSQGSDQEISVALVDSSVQLAGAFLTVTSATGETLRIESTAVVDATAAFVFGADLAAGKYVIKGCEFTVASDDAVHYVDLSSFNYGFSVAEAKQANAESSDSPAVTAYYADESGNVRASSDLATALSESTEGTSLATASDSVASLASARSSSNAMIAPVIALDAGHGGSDPGACANGLKEADLTWKIADACRAKLESYGFAVVMVRDQYGDYDGYDYKYRVRRALDQGAQVYVSFHIDSSVNSSATGASVLVPSNDGSSNTQVSEDLAYKVMDNLAALGLSYRGLDVRDDLAVVNGSAAAGIPGILIEHGFISNESDCANYFTDEGCKRLGEADAEAIIEQFPKSTWVDYSPVYDYNYYIANNPDVLQVYGGDEKLTLNHFIEYGMKEGRQGCADFNVRCYQANYDDLWIAYGNDLQSYYLHYLAYGQYEGRTAGSYLDGKSEPGAASVTVQTSSKFATAEASFMGGDARNASEVRFAIWSEEGDQDDLEWITASRAANMSWSTSINVAAHATYGKYLVHCYAVLDGNLTFVGGTSFDVPAPSASSLSIANVDNQGGTFDVVLSGINAPTGVNVVHIPVWTESDQSDIVWYEASRQGDGSFKATVNALNHSYKAGSVTDYIVHAYLTDSFKQTFVGSTTAQLSLASDFTRSYKIMGSSTVDAAAMASQYNSMGYTYPSTVYASKGASTIEEFCEILCQQAAKEGVRAEVVYAQAMLETGYLQFGGDVKAEQCNFAGLGATGNGVCGEVFSDVAEGLLAQVQHLKGYASTDDLNEPCVDPRFKYLASKRGTAPTVDGLAGTWAADTGYATKIKAIMNTLQIKTSHFDGEVQLVYRLYNPITSEHLFTTDKSEYESLIQHDWAQEGETWTSPVSGSKGVYRLYNPALGAMAKMSHHYTTDKAEADKLVAENGWQYDNDGSPIFYSAQSSDGTPLSGASAVYRLYNSALSAHHFTLDADENSKLISEYQWIGESTGFYAYVMP